MARGTQFGEDTTFTSPISRRSVAILPRCGNRKHVSASLCIFGLHLKVVLQETGCTVDARNALQRTALHLACERGQRLVCEELIAQKADVNATSGGGTTPLHYACRSQALSVVELLLQQQGIAIDVEDNTRRTPLQSVPEGCDLIRDRLQAFLEGTMQDDEFDA
ncbi:unnamed protein product [Amoebophrya sp. A25]|nr:unnamed protein product [Amoebophrya sp. A25]|eukprot:GSA25T00022732001.1